MDRTKETIGQIGDSISIHVNKEISGHYPTKAIARAHCTITDHQGKEHVENYWLTNGDIYKAGLDYKDITGAVAGHSCGNYIALVDDGRPVSKNTKLGEILVKFHSGSYEYRVPDPYRRKKFYENKVEIHNRSSYSPYNEDPSEVEIRISGESSPYRYSRLSELLNIERENEAKLRELEAERKRLEEERIRIARELEEKKAREEKERLEALQRQKEEEERKAREEIERIEKLMADKVQEIKAVRSFMRKNVMLRSQHLLDQYQEDAKRSHIFDGIPIIIDGGPGTGKTTTVIQRLMFLLSYQALTEYGAPLSQKQIENLTNPEERDNHWLFFSPTDMLLQYLRDNMREEGLKANDRNSRTVAKFRKKAMIDYKLFNPSKNGPFKDYSPAQGEEVLILDAKAVISDFEQYIIVYCNKLLQQRVELNTVNHPWNEDAMSIKSRCKDSGKIKDLDGLMNLFNSLQENEKQKVKVWSDELKEQMNGSVQKLRSQILKDESLVEKLRALFEQWRKDRFSSDEHDDEDVIIDEDDENDVSFSRQEFETQLFQELKKVLKQLGLKKHDSKIKISKHNQELLDLIKDSINEEDLCIDSIGSIALFVRNYASLCRGIESNIIGIIHRLYKSFRKCQLESELYRKELLKKVINKDSNKYLHPDEQNLVLGFINEILHRIYKKSRIRFDGLNHKYALAFKETVRNIIGIDEATDYSLLDYYFMVSFRHYEFSSITLCGDLMQGLNSNGIANWDVLRDFNLPKLEVKSLNISYRQLPTLLNMARELYHDDLGSYPNYRSEMASSEKEPQPLMFISNNEWEKADWISERILDILNIYDNELPSVAIFVGDNVNISDFIERISDIGKLSGIDIVNCSGDRQLQNKEMIRVFRLSEVKGMEFEAAFFYDIDDAISSHDQQLMRRYLYVGISRATSHLAATMKTWENENIIKYFDTESDSWEI
ncbi:MAG: hypothetical protein K2K58_08600 [Muribaculaceae bacterium]|nr:hypothetical protein [Muribaculaceae bacterium]